MVEVAWAASRTKGTFFKARYQHLARRIGKKKAIIAVAHSILKAVYHVLKDQVPYRELGADYIDDMVRQKRKKYYKGELKKLGFEVELTPTKIA